MRFFVLRPRRKRPREAGVLLAKLVSSTASGTRRLYAVDPRGLAAVREYFDQFWNQALAAFADVVENPAEERQ